MSGVELYQNIIFSYLLEYFGFFVIIMMFLATSYKLYQFMPVMYMVTQLMAHDGTVSSEYIEMG